MRCEHHRPARLSSARLICSSGAQELLSWRGRRRAERGLYAAWRGNYVCIFIFGLLPAVMKLGLTVPNHQAVESHPHPASSPPLPPTPPPPLSLWDRCSPVSPVTLLAPSDCRRHMPGPAAIPVWTSLSPSRLELYARPLIGAKRLKWGTTNDHCSRLTDPIDKQTNNKYIDWIP